MENSQDNLNAPLINAIEACSLEEVKQLLQAGADPNKFSGEKLPLHIAAALGHKEIFELLLEYNADFSQRNFFNGLLPFTVASLNGHHDIAKLIQDLSQQREEKQRDEHLERLGWEIGSIQHELMIAGTRRIENIKEAFDATMANEAVAREIKFSTFEGWIKQLDTEKIKPIQTEALKAAFPLFFDLNGPTEKMLKEIKADGIQKHFKGFRTRRFAGDDLLPRSHYYTLCKDETGHDEGTLVCEMWAYSHITRSGKIDLVDMADPTAAKRLEEWGIESPGNNSILVVFLPGPDSGISPFLLHFGIPQRIVAFPLPIKVTHQHIDKVVDLRIPEIADCFARAVSQAVLEFDSPATGKTTYHKCFPFRQPVDTFEELLPEMLTQEHGGGVLSLVAGAILRKAGANALIFPSARNDSSLRIRNGEVRRAVGWNMVDYRNAPPLKQQIALNLDDIWPTKVQMGPGFTIRTQIPQLFTNVQIGYYGSKTLYGSFEVDGLINTHAILRDIELQNFRDNKILPSWWML